VLISVKDMPKIRRLLASGWRKLGRTGLVCQATKNMNKASEEAEVFRQVLQASFLEKNTVIDALFDDAIPNTLITYESAVSIGLLPWEDKWVLARDGMMEESTCMYLVPVVDWQGKTQLIKAAGVKYAGYCGKTQVPELAKVVFPEAPKEVMEKCHEEGLVDMVIGAGNAQWLPQHLYDSWQPEDNLLCGGQSSQHNSWSRRRGWRANNFRFLEQRKQHDQGPIRGVYRF
jgi:hypothetical protein